MKLYHKNLGFPKNITLNNVTDFPLTWSNHSKNQLNTKYGIDLFPEKISFKQSDIFEIELNENSELVKLCVRLPCTGAYDMCLAITREGIVKTGWLNSKSDTHKTLDTSKYLIPDS